MKIIDTTVPAVKMQWIVPEITAVEINGNGVAGTDFASELS